MRRGLPVKKNCVRQGLTVKKTVPRVQAKKIKYAGIVDKFFIGAVNKTFYLGVFFVKMVLTNSDYNDLGGQNFYSLIGGPLLI